MEARSGFNVGDRVVRRINRPSGVTPAGTTGTVTRGSYKFPPNSDGAWYAGVQWDAPYQDREENVALKDLARVDEEHDAEKPNVCIVIYL